MPNPTLTPNSEEQSIIPHSKPNKLWLTILISVLASAIVVGLVIYFIMAKSADNQQENLEQQVELLQNQIEQLKQTTLFLDKQEQKTPEQRELEVDSDNDGLSDSRELQLGSDPNNPDTDGDGYLDGNEVANGYDPLVDEKARAEQQDEFANWQTYRNEKYGYEIKYSEKYFLNDRSTAESVNFDTEGPGAGLSIEVIGKSFVNRMEELADSGWQGKGSKGFNNVIWNILYLEGTELVPGMWHKSIRQLSPEDKVIEITLNRSTEELFNQILSTFKFITPTTSESEVQVRKLIEKFEKAYIDKDKELLFSFFTDPILESDKQLRSTLKSGKDLEGNPGGPELFVTNTAFDQVLNYEVVSLTESIKSEYKVLVKESFQGYDNAKKEYFTSNRSRTFEIIKQEDNWLIDKYYPESYPGKYTGFLSGY